MSTWKACERSVARIIGGERIPVTGREDGNVADVLTPVWCVEVKHRADAPLKLKALTEHAGYSIGVFGLSRPHTGYLRANVALLRNIPDVRPVNSWKLRPRVADIVFPAWAFKAFVQAARAAKHHKRAPLVVIHAKGTPIDESLCFYGFDWKALLK